MSRFGKKLILWLMGIIIVLGGISLSMTTVGLEKYYLATQKLEMHQISEEIRALPLETLYQNTHALGKEHHIVLLTLPWQKDWQKLNEQLKNAFTEQGILLEKLWLWEDNAEKLEAGKVVNELYNQGNRGYSLFIKYYLKDSTLVVMSRTIPHIDAVLKLINLFIMGVWLIALTLIVVCIVIYVRRITKPLLELEHLIKDIGHLKFNQIELKTGDELESLAKGINQMSAHLQASHQQLEEKNEQMKELLANVSHELKTPIALIKAYGIAIEDGMDDGTFIATILEQNEVMENRVTKLLMLAKKESQDSKRTSINLSEMVESYLKQYAVYRNEVVVKMQLEEVGMLTEDQEVISCAISNFISNAIKYTANGKVEVRCYEEAACVHLEVRNGITEKTKRAIEQLWEPFYVVEASRNKMLCGTGLGLYITHKLLEREGIVHGCFLEGENIVFYMTC
ncbi:MAG: sensor histidine kinase [Cellulosilyticaceae bacterium]